MTSFPTITATVAALIGLLAVLLAARVIVFRVREGRSRVVDGPFTETKEQLGGYYLIDVPDLDAALSWAERCPGAAHGTVEVRPVWRS